MVVLSNVIWIDSNVYNEENAQYRKELESIWYFKVKWFENIKEAINYLKEIQFVETKIIVSGRLYTEFLSKFIENLKEINVIPKIIIFAKEKELFIKNNKKYEEYINHSFYNFGGIKTTFEEIKNFLINQNYGNKVYKNKEENIQMTFEYIDSQAKLALPLFYKTLIDIEPSDKVEKYTNEIYEKYSKENKDINELLTQIKSLKDIPIELLSKYYIRAYTMESNFYTDINKDLGLNKKENHLPFIKTLYEGTKLKSLSLASNNTLYRGAKIANDEINKIKHYLKNKIENLPASIVFSKSFLSFSKEKEIAESYLENKNNNKNLSKVLYILEKDDNVDYSLATHGDIEKISFFPNEREVLFYPFSSFEIKDIKEVKLKGGKIYQIKLLYLGKYLKEIKKNKNLIEKVNDIPDSKFKKEIIDFGLIKPEQIKIIILKHYLKNIQNIKKKLIMKINLIISINLKIIILMKN